MDATKFFFSIICLDLYTEISYICYIMNDMHLSINRLDKVFKGIDRDITSRKKQIN